MNTIYTSEVNLYPIFQLTLTTKPEKYNSLLSYVL